MAKPLRVVVTPDGDIELKPATSDDEETPHNGRTTQESPSHLAADDEDEMYNEPFPKMPPPDMGWSDDVGEMYDDASDDVVAFHKKASSRTAAEDEEVPHGDETNVLAPDNKMDTSHLPCTRTTHPPQITRKFHPKKFSGDFGELCRTCTG